MPTAKRQPTKRAATGNAPNRQERARRWNWWLSISSPWEGDVSHVVSPLHLLGFPLAFTQGGLLSPEEYVREADKRGVKLRTEQLMELHRTGVLVPFFRVLQPPPHSPSDIPLATSASEFERGGFRFGGSLGLVIWAARHGHLVDADRRPFRSWKDGLSTRVNGRVQRYPSVFYSPYQLLALGVVEATVQRMTVRRDSAKEATYSLHSLDPHARAALNGCRRLAILLSAVEMHYLPNIMRVIVYGKDWEREDPRFDSNQRLGSFGLTPEQLGKAAERLLMHANSIDQLGSWYELVRLAHPDSWSQLKGPDRLAMDFRIAAELLLECIDDLDRKELSAPPPKKERAFRTILDDRLAGAPGDLDLALMERGLSPYPALLLVLEGKTEVKIMPRILEMIYGQPVPMTLVEPVLMDTIDRDLDLLVRHVLGFRLGTALGDAVLLDRSPTRVLVAVDPEKRFADVQKQEQERVKLVRRLYETLPTRLQTSVSLSEIDTLVEVTTWGTLPWEFANFTDGELATGARTVVQLPAGVTWRDVRASVAQQRRTKGPNIEVVTARWGRKVDKVQLAEALWPRLRWKIERRAVYGTLDGLPAGRVAVRALRLALQSHRRRVALQVR